MIQDIAIKILSSIASMMSQILCQSTTKITCGLNSLTLASSEIRTVGMPQIRKCKLA